MACFDNILVLIKTTKSQTWELVQSSSIFIKCLWIFMIFGYILSFSQFFYHNTVISAGEIMPPNFKIWTIFTHAFIEIHIWTLLCNLLVIFLYGQLLEPLWGGLEMYKFILINTLISAMFAVFIFTVQSLTRQEVEYLFNYHIYGFSASVAGFCVAVKQVMPEPILFTFPTGKFQNRHIPLLLLVLVYLATLIGIVEITYPVLFTFGLVNSWVYLRFYQRHSNGCQGDSADKFSLASFFPVIIQPVIKVPSNLVFNFLVRIKICKKPSSSLLSSPSIFLSTQSPLGESGSTSGTTGVPNLPGTQLNNAIRQKQIALKALDIRLMNADASHLQSSSQHLQQEFPAPQQQQQLQQHQHFQHTQKQQLQLPRSKSFNKNEHLIDFDNPLECKLKSIK